MKILITRWFSLFFSVFLFISYQSTAQNGAFELRFNLDSYDEPTGYAYVDIEIKAQSPTTEFLITDQNYRFHFNSNVVPAVTPGIQPPTTNPTDRSVHIFQELELSSVVFKDGTISFYDAHTLTGTSGTLTSVNINHAGGDGTPVYADTWVKVNQIRLEIANDQDSLCLDWNGLGTSPETIIIEKVGAQFFQVDEGVFYDICYYLPDEILFLPVELTSFKVEENNCSANLSWVTASEVDSDKFIIHKSGDGENFEAIGQLDASGSTAGHKYQFSDNNPGKRSYYRLEMIDLDGEYSYSEIIVFNNACQESQTIDLFPNPVRSGESMTFKINDTGIIGGGNIIISDMLGNTLVRQSIELQEGNNEINTNIPDLPSGNYIYQLISDHGYAVTQRFIVQN